MTSPPAKFSGLRNPPTLRNGSAYEPSSTGYDDAATGTTTKLVDTFTPVAGTWYPMPFAFSKGLNVVIGGTVSATVGYTPG
jgi:hypothetical protein